MSTRVFDDSSMIAEMGVRDAYEKCRRDLQLYMAMCAALVRRLGNEVQIGQNELLLDCTIYTAMGDDMRSFKVWTEGQNLIEEVDDIEPMDGGGDNSSEGDLSHPVDSEDG